MTTFISRAEQKTPKKCNDSLTGSGVDVGAGSSGLRGCGSDGLFGASFAGYEHADALDHFGGGGGPLGQGKIRGGGAGRRLGGNRSRASRQVWVGCLLP